MSDDAEHYCLFSETAAQIAYDEARAIAKETGHFPPDHWVACVVPYIDLKDGKTTDCIITHASLTSNEISNLVKKEPHIAQAKKLDISTSKVFMNLNDLKFIHAHDIHRFGLEATHGDLQLCALLLQ